MEYLTGSGVEVDQGILVDERMRTNVIGIWAAGDVAQARGFFEPSKDPERHPAQCGGAGPDRRHGYGG